MAKPYRFRFGFTLVEVLIAIVSVGIILPPLFKLIILMRDSNSQIINYVVKEKEKNKALSALYLDILSSDGNITINKNDNFSRVCIEHSLHSLYGLNQAKVCWLVLKRDNQLVRIEGNKYDLPLTSNNRVESDLIFKNIELFDVYYLKNSLLVVIEEQNKQPIAFEIDGLLQK